MNTTETASPGAHAESRASWTPLVVIAMAQIMMIFNVSTLQVSIEAIASSFGTSATSIGAAIVTYALAVAGLILLGARVAQILGSRRVFRVSVIGFGLGMALMAVSPGTITMIVAQVIAGIAAAALAPTLVVLIADNYRGAQRERALGWLGASPAMGIVLAFLIAGSLSTWLGWRFMFGLLVAFAALIVSLGRKLAPTRGRSDVSIDKAGVALAALAMLLISIGASNLTAWGVLLARASAPFSVQGMSPAPLMILSGIFLVQAFISWSRRTAASGRTPLVRLEVIDTPDERSALFSIFIISAIASAVTFLVPLYIQVVQGGSSLQTAVAVIPFSVASFVAAVLVVHLFDRASPRRIAQSAFLLVAGGIALLGTVVRNDWSDLFVMLSMSIVGLGEGALVTLLFNVVVSASPKHLAGDVGSARGATNNLATAVGTAAAGALLIGLLSAVVHEELIHNPVIPLELKSQVDLDQASFVSNDRLRQSLALTTATQAEVTEAVRINTNARLLALKLTLFTLAGLALLAYFPAGALPSRARAAASSPASSNNEQREHPSAAAPLGT